MSVAGMLASYSSVRDAFFKYVTMLLPGNGTNGAQNNTFLDSSSNALAFTRNGNTTQGTFTPYGNNWSAYINGAEVTAGSNSAFAFGTGAYTVELWIFQSLALSAYTAGQGPCFVFCDTTGGFGFWNNVSTGITIDTRAGSTILASSTQLPVNQWNHLVAVRSGTGAGQTSIFLNGTRIANGTDTTNYTITGPLKIGGISIGGYYAVGNISNVRIVKGSAVYDPTQSTLTVPTSPLTAVSGTSLLTCQSNRLRDNSSNAFSISYSGSPAPVIQNFSPFNLSLPYIPSVNGGSGYFDGNGDNIQVTTATSAVVITGGAFTVEAWVYNTNTGGSFYEIISQDNGSSTGQTFQFRINANKLEFLYFTTSARASVVTATSTGTIPVNSWTHVAATWGGANTPIRLFINGTLDTTTANVATIYAPASISTAIGSQILASGTPGYFTGFISDARMLKGTQLYTATFTPPTAPLTAITNTALLCSFTNAGIIDNSMLNDGETVGATQISTTQSKFGGSSINFNGTTSYLNFPAKTYWVMKGDFTVECWFYVSTIQASMLFDQYTGAGAGAGDWQLYITAAGNVVWYYDNTSSINSSFTVSTGQWYHIACTRSGSSLKLFINGTQYGPTATYSGQFGQNNTMWFGAQHTGGPGYFFAGYADDIRITNGYARYTANFTVPSSAFPTS